MSVILDARPHAAAVRAAVTAALAPAWTAYDYGKVPGADGNPGVLPNIFCLVSIERRFNPNLHLSAQATSGGWRVSVRSLGRTADESRWAMARVTQALNEARVTVEGRVSSPIQFESDQNPVLDDTRYSGLSSWTYAH